VVSRRWLLTLTGSRAREDGYLTEPYKVVEHGRHDVGREAWAS
jgi:hypothetical protein